MTENDYSYLDSEEAFSEEWRRFCAALGKSNAHRMPVLRVRASDNNYVPVEALQEYERMLVRSNMRVVDGGRD